MPESSPPAEEPNIEIDGENVDDAGFDEQLSTFTASLSSSVLDFPMEHGRRYHAYRQGAYVFPNDERELERLDTMHIMMINSMSGKLFLAPIDQDNLQSILDIGTGTGSLAIEVADLLPQAQVIGCDLSPVQPTWVPPNVKFEVDDVESEWTYSFKFDFIICRYMAASIGDWPKLIQNIYENLNPGAWGEFQDWDLQYATDDGSLTDEHYTKKWNDDFVLGLAKINRDARPGPRLLERAKAAGFVNLEEHVFKVPLGPWAKDPQLKKVGMLNLVQLLDGLEAFSLKVFPVLGYSREETEVLLAKVRKEVKAREFHTYVTFYVVYGQKPVEAKHTE